MDLPFKAKKLRHNSNKPVSLGCISCPELSICGGLQVTAPIFSCLDYCKCTNPVGCQYVCRSVKATEQFIARFREVETFELSTIPRSIPITYPDINGSVPEIYGRSGRNQAVCSSVVAIPLKRLFSLKTGKLLFNSREEIIDKFLLTPDSKLIIDGVAEDKYLEAYWSIGRENNITAQIAKINPDLMTSLNFSLFTDVPRWDNLHNMKRIAICWNELVSLRIPTSLHINARTTADWERYTEFIRNRNEVRAISFEFGTGPSNNECGQWHVEKLGQLAIEVDRDLKLVIRGGEKHVPYLLRFFPTLILIDTSSYIKTMKRSTLAIADNKLQSIQTPTKPGMPLDTLLQKNIEVKSKLLEIKKASINP